MYLSTLYFYPLLHCIHTTQRCKKETHHCIKEMTHCVKVMQLFLSSNGTLLKRKAAFTESNTPKDKRTAELLKGITAFLINNPAMDKRNAAFSKGIATKEKGAGAHFSSFTTYLPKPASQILNIRYMKMRGRFWRTPTTPDKNITPRKPERMPCLPGILSTTRQGNHWMTG